jgi:hypothetical protein
MDSEKNQDEDQDEDRDQLQLMEQEEPKNPLDPPENLAFGDLVSWIVSHQNMGSGHHHRRIKQESPIHNSPVISNFKEQRKSQVKETKDKILNVTRGARVNRSSGKTGMDCLICGKEIRPNQAFRALPKDKNCQEERVYHLRTCGPGSLRWKAFKENGKKPLQESISGGQMSFNWGK